MNNTTKAIALGTAVSGTLDLVSAFVFSAVDKHTPMQVLHSVATGPFGDAIATSGLTVALMGVLTHYSLMAIMVTVFVLAMKRQPALLDHVWLVGIAYGVALYVVMYWIVLPWRYPTYVPKTALWPMGNALFSHCLCVGLPMALIARRVLRLR